MAFSYYKRFFSFSIIISLLGAIEKPALGWPPIFGFELEFTNDIVFNGTGSDQYEYIYKLQDEVLKLCRNCRETSPQIITFDGGYWVRISKDNGVIEIPTKPATVEELLKAKVNLEVLFKAADKVGLEVNELLSNHISAGHRDSFKSDFHRRQFLADYFNHPELALGIHELDLANARPVALAPFSIREQLAESFVNFDKGKLSYDRMLGNIHVLLIRGGGGSKSSALNVGNVGSVIVPLEEERFEIRAVRMATTVDQLILDVQLYDARIKYLDTVKEPIPYVVDSVVPLAVLKQRFKSFVVNSGLRWEDYQNYIPKNWPKYLRDWASDCNRLNEKLLGSKARKKKTGW